MYWNNPLIRVVWPSELDPVADSLHNGKHCIFYDPAVSKHDIHNKQSLQQLCAWTNAGILDHGWRVFQSDPRNHDNLANLVRLNIWVQDLPHRGSVKPMLLTYTGGKYNSDFSSGTGASRLRAMEHIDSIQTVTAFITTSAEHRAKFQHLEEITTMSQFVRHCQADSRQVFLFRLTGPDAPFGMDWYEYDSSLTKSVTPGEKECLIAINKYMQQHPDTVFDIKWFSVSIEWDFT